MDKILLTGATGFLGSAVAESLLQQAFPVSALVRQHAPMLADSIKQIEINDLTALPQNIAILHDTDVLIHIAARAHIMQETTSDPLSEFRRINTTATINLAKLAADAGVKRFIFISSIKVNGEFTSTGQPFTEEISVPPKDPYALSKFEAEHGLLSLAKSTGMEVVIIRPPLIYGTGVKANFLNMIQWMKKGIPLPLGAINNQRSLIALDNLVNFITVCITAPKAANEVFLIADDEDVSTTQLLQKVAKAWHKKSLLLPIPSSFIRFIAELIGKQAIADRLCNNLQVDSAKARKLLDWKAIISIDQQLQKMAASSKL